MPSPQFALACGAPAMRSGSPADGACTIRAASMDTFDVLTLRRFDVSSDVFRFLSLSSGRKSGPASQRTPLSEVFRSFSLVCTKKTARPLPSPFVNISQIKSVFICRSRFRLLAFGFWFSAGPWSLHFSGLFRSFPLFFAPLFFSRPPRPTKTLHPCPAKRLPQFIIHHFPPSPSPPSSILTF